MACPLGGPLPPKRTSVSSFASVSSSFLLLFFCLVCLSLWLSFPLPFSISVPLSPSLPHPPVYAPSPFSVFLPGAASRRRSEASLLPVSASGNPSARQAGPLSQVRPRRQVSSASAGGSTRQVVGGRWRATRRRRWKLLADRPLTVSGSSANTRGFFLFFICFHF